MHTSPHTVQQLRSGELTGLQRLDLSCGLTAFPPEIFSLADSLEVLNLSGNALQTLPHDLHRLHKLKVLFCSDNPFTTLPESVGQCAELEVVGFKANRIRHVPAASLPPRLRWLILTDNQVESLPAALGERPRLQKLMLAGNRLQRLPDEMASSAQLELLRIAANRFEALPWWLASLPRLSWLAYAGNPLQAAAARSPGAADIPWQALTLQQPPLGEGASGVIHPALWAAGDEAARPVAVKLFKGAVTSDGSPASEMAACLAAGVHPHLVGAIGRLAGHPAHTPGLVMERIAPAFSNLAGPPSLDSCTRDIYRDDTRFSPLSALQTALGIASAAAHLHARGILHGDLYAHNILWDGEGQALLGDFGAASFLPVADEAASLALQRLEVRAFGCLVEELLARCAPAPEVAASPAAAALLSLQRACLQAQGGARPLFSEIEQRLRAAAAAQAG